MLHVSVRCYAELNDLLPREQQFITSSLSLPLNTTIEELVRKIGISQSAIDLVLVNENSVSMAYQLKENDRVALYPVFESFDISSVTEVQIIPFVSRDSFSMYILENSQIIYECSASTHSIEMITQMESFLQFLSTSIGFF